MRSVTVDVYEGEDRTPILSHTAHGQTVKEAMDILATHREYDTFLDAALEEEIAPGRYFGTFKGIPLRTLVREE